jgi:hypothetical protein
MVSLSKTVSFPLLLTLKARVPPHIISIGYPSIPTIICQESWHKSTPHYTFSDMNSEDFSLPFS